MSASKQGFTKGPDHLAWTKEKPSAPGYYLVRGYEIGLPPTSVAVVEVGFDEGNLLSCNLHETNSDGDGLNNGFRVSDLDDDFEWCPLLPVINPSYSHATGEGA